MKKDRTEVLFWGIGGQGLVLASIILAEAVGVYEGKNVVQSQAYTAVVRGGTSKASVVISEKEEILFPQVIFPDILIAFSQEAYSSNKDVLKPTSIVIYDNDMVKIEDNVNFKKFGIPFFRTAREELKIPFAGNILALGALSAITDIVGLSALEKALLTKIREEYHDINKKALEKGFNLGRGLISN